MSLVSRRASLLAALALIALAAATFWKLLHLEGWRPSGGEERLVLEPASFGDLPGWKEDDLSQALPALLRSCRRLMVLPANESLGIAGTAGDWRPACEAAAQVPTNAARSFFESRFQPFAASAPARKIGRAHV